MAFSERAFVLHLSRAACVELLYKTLYLSVAIRGIHVTPRSGREYGFIKSPKSPRESSKKSACPKRHHTIESKRLTSKHFQTEREKIKAGKLPQPCQNNISKHTRSPRHIRQTSFLSRPLPHNSSPRLARRRSESTQQHLKATLIQKMPLKRILSRRYRFSKRRTPLAATMSALPARVASLQA